jgi:hypothetical protein
MDGVGMNLMDINQRTTTTFELLDWWAENSDCLTIFFNKETHNKKAYDFYMYVRVQPGTQIESLTLHSQHDILTFRN